MVPTRDSGALLDETIGLLTQRLAGLPAEIIVVENGSTDDTYARCQRLIERWNNPTVSFSVLRTEPGLGNALRTGALASRGALVLLTADDLPFGTDDLDAAERLRSEADGTPLVIVGSKAHPASDVDRGVVRNVLTRTFGVLRRTLLGMRTGDPQGTFIVNGKLVRQLAPHIVEPGFLFTTELAYVLELLGIPVVEVPVALRAGHGSHKSRVSIRDAAQMAIGLRRLRSRHRGRWEPGTSGRVPSPKARMP